jgi:mitochondrial fission protein ELM1
MENQCVGLAERLDVSFHVKRVRLRAPWKWLSPFLRLGLRFAFDSQSDNLVPPWPNLVIASGRAGAMACLYIKREAAKQGKKVFTVHIQNPVIDPSRFDLVAVPRHDGLLGANVITTRGALHRVTKQRLTDEAARFQDSYGALPEPRLAVVIGGRNAVYDLLPQDMERMAAQLAELAHEIGGSLMVTTSRRTGAENLAILQKALQGTSHKIWDGEGDNPYYAMLGLADAIFVTADSVNMTSEACTTGKPVYVLPLSGGSDKFRRFHQALRDDGMTRPFDGKLKRWFYTPLNDVELVAQRVREMMGKNT